jgi:hypothetical protein
MTQELSPVLHAIAAYWKEVCGLRLRPERADIDPAAIPRAVLPHVLMLDVLAEDEFRYRLIGTGITKHVGRDLTGQNVDPAGYGQSHQLLVDVCRDVVRTGRPMQVMGEGRWSEHHWKFGAVLLPLGPVYDVNILLGGCEFEPAGRFIGANADAEILSLKVVPLVLEAIRPRSA